MNEHNDPHDTDDEDSEFEDGYDGGFYIVDSDTQRLLEVVIGMIHMLSQTQMEANARENCAIIADELAERFGLSDVDLEVEEIIHGDEVLYKPRGGVMGDDKPEAEGPAVDAE